MILNQWTSASMNERRKENPVHDKGVSVSLNLNNILTGLVLAVMLWGGRAVVSNLQESNDKLEAIREVQIINVYRLDRIEQDYYAHEKKPAAH